MTRVGDNLRRLKGWVSYNRTSWVLLAKDGTRWGSHDSCITYHLARFHTKVTAQKETRKKDELIEKVAIRGHDTAHDLELYAPDRGGGDSWPS